MKTLVVMLTIALALVCARIKADDSETVHATAHIGASYALNTFLYGFNKRALTLSGGDAIIFSSFETFLIGMSYEWLTLNSTLHINKALGQNALGIIFSTGSIVIWRF